MSKKKKTEEATTEAAPAPAVTPKKSIKKYRSAGAWRLRNLLTGEVYYPRRQPEMAATAPKEMDCWLRSQLTAGSVIEVDE
jgi:hypothetical protein